MTWGIDSRCYILTWQSIITASLEPPILIYKLASYRHFLKEGETRSRAYGEDVGSNISVVFAFLSSQALEFKMSSVWNRNYGDVLHTVFCLVVCNTTQRRYISSLLNLLLSVALYCILPNTLASPHFGNIGFLIPPLCFTCFFNAYKHT